MRWARAVSRGRCPSRCRQQGSDELGNIKGHPRERKEKKSIKKTHKAPNPSLLVEKIKKKKPDNDPQEVCV